MEADGAPMSYGTKKYVAPPYEDPNQETITIPPSTELIPDEYEHDDNQKGLVVIFSSAEDAANTELLQSAFRDQRYEISEDNMYEVRTTDGVLETLKEIARTSHKDKTCLIVVFMATAMIDDRFLPDQEKSVRKGISVKDVWSHFSGENCPSFRNKPKIFIFQASKPSDTTQTDSVIISPPEGAYDIPAEADMLIVFKRVEDPVFRNAFMEQLCNNFDKYGVKEDMVALVTHTFHEDNVRPLVISTLTRKFYISPSSSRGHYYDLYSNHDDAIHLLEKLKHSTKSRSLLRRWQEAAASSNASYTDASSSRSERPSRAESKRVSRATSVTSSVDSKSKLKAAGKDKPVWRY